MQTVTERRRTRGQGGFTLIELLVVIAILGVLAGVVVFAVGGIQDNSDKTACNIDARTVKTAIQAYRAQERVWPVAFADTGVAPNVVPGLTGFLENPSKNVAITYGATNADEPTLAWDGSCADIPAADLDPL